MKNVKVDLTGKTFGRWTVIRRAENKGKHVRYLCVCQCGNVRTVLAQNLQNGKSQSCGCFFHDVASERISAALKQHGGKGTRLYSVWKAMRQRCMNPKNSEFPNYGGRGITVCSEWDDFANFREWANTHGYSDSLFIDRIEGSRGYSPDNCRWATMKEQVRNRRNTFRAELNGEVRPVAEWAEILGLPYTTCAMRARRGIPLDAPYAPMRKE